MTSCQRSCCPPPSSSSSSSTPSSPFLHQHSTTPLTAAEELTLTRCKRERDYERELSLAHLRRQRQAVISCIACVLHQLFDHRCDILDSERLTMFHTEKKPSISVQAYFERIAKYGDCSTEALIFSLIHINRIMHQKPSFEITSLNIHRLLLTSIMCSAKFFDDHYFNNTYYSKIGGVPPHEMNSLEIEFLALINFDLSIDPAMFHQFESELCNPELHQECDCYYWQVQLQDAKFVAQQTAEMNIEMECYQVMGPDGNAHDLRKPVASTVTSTPVAAPVPVTIPVTAPSAPLSLASSIIPIAAQTKIKSSHPSPLVTAVDPSCCDSSMDSCHMSISPNIHMSPQSSCSSSSSSDSSHSSGSLSMSTSSSIHSSTNSSRSESPLTDSMSPLTSRSQKSPSTATSSCTSSPCVYDTCPLDARPIKPHAHSAQLVQAAR